jgi:hypothetical protein
MSIGRDALLFAMIVGRKVSLFASPRFTVRKPLQIRRLYYMQRSGALGLRLFLMAAVTSTYCAASCEGISKQSTADRLIECIKGLERHVSQGEEKLRQLDEKLTHLEQLSGRLENLQARVAGIEKEAGQDSNKVCTTTGSSDNWRDSVV